eukprot:g66038.t1
MADLIRKPDTGQSRSRKKTNARKLYSGQTNKAKKMLERWRKDCKISPETEIEIIEQVPGTLLLYKCVSCSKHFVDTDWSKKHYKQFRKECAAGVDIVWRKDKVEEHWKSQMHRVAVNATSDRGSLENMKRRRREVLLKSHKTLRNLFRNVYMVGVQAWSLSTALHLRILEIANGDEDLQLLPSGELGDPGANYSSPQIVREFYSTTADVVSEDLGKAYFPPENRFPWHKFVSGSLDGCSANFSERVGVANLFRALVFSKLSLEEITKHPGFLPVQHCSCHRLALVVKHAFMDVDYIRNMFEPVLVELCLWYKNSHVRFESLNHTVHELFGFSMQSGFALPVATRWMSHEKSIIQIRERLPAIIKDLTASSTSKSIKPDDRARATRLLSKVNTFQFYAIIYLLSDVLQILASFSKTMQSVKAELSHVLGGFRRAHQLLASFRANVSHMSYLMDFFALVNNRKLGKLNDLDPDSQDFEGALNRNIWCFDKKVNAPFLDSLLELLCARFTDTEPILQGMIDVACPRDLFPFLRYEPAEVKDEASDDEDFLQPQSPQSRTSDDEDDFEEEKQQHPPPPPPPPPSPPPPLSNQEEELLHEASADMCIYLYLRFSRCQSQHCSGRARSTSSCYVSPNTVLEGLEALPAATVKAIPAISLRYKVSELQLRTEILLYNVYIAEVQKSLEEGWIEPCQTVTDVAQELFCYLTYSMHELTTRTFPTVCKIIKEACSTASDTICVEQGFSNRDIIFAKYRNRLLDASGDDLMTLKLNAPPFVSKEAEDVLYKAIIALDEAKPRKYRSVNYNNNKDKQPIKLKFKRQSRKAESIKVAFYKLDSYEPAVVQAMYESAVVTGEKQREKELRDRRGKVERLKEAIAIGEVKTVKSSEELWGGKSGWVVVEAEHEEREKGRKFSRTNLTSVQESGNHQ